MRLLLVDNYDSFVHNLGNLIRTLGAQVDVIENDRLHSVTEYYPAVVISPGPGNPENPSDCGELFEYLEKGNYGKILGVCFGHQALGKYLGSRVVPAPTLMHGEIDSIRHFGGHLFRGVPDIFRSVRYHSLIITERDGILTDAVSETDGSVMAFHSPDFRYSGLQFHPESFYSEYGDVIMRNFIGGIAK
ncbi:MAG: aminodeoxychorismate/anthranilate synthase component II [Candidatus Thermoplasmatota archaeon]|nr:aminodeoxychorismate/anthranilate synthase component II [Candidatus Thermoplasmatota archaeon]